MSEKILGIDLGTSNSAACIYIDDKTTMIPSAEGASLYGKAFPSYVAFRETGEILVGQPAKEESVINPENTISEIKRHMGTDYKVNIQGKDYTPQEISAMILQKIKKDAESFLGEEITKAVITVPANFDDNQRNATKDAGEIAGLTVRRLINEPTAASLAYGIKKQGENLKIMVFDLGGGTLDITIMETGHGFNVKATTGNTALGGTDMDLVIAKYLADEFEKKHGIDLTQDEEPWRRLREGAEKAKIALSNKVDTDVKLPFIAISNDGSPLTLDETINRSKLESLVRPIVERCGESIDQAIQDAHLTMDDIDKVILVGGPTRMPIVQDYVENYTGKLVERGIDPMECVSQGAAIRAAMFVGDIEPVPVVDRTPLSLGTVVVGGITSVMIEKQTIYPTSFTETFTTVSDNQTEVLCEVVQGENKMADLNTQLGSFTLEGIPPAPRGVPQIEVTFAIDEDGILNVTAIDKATGNEKSITVTGATKLSDSEIEQKQRDLEENAEEDDRRANLRELINKADGEIYTAQNFIDDPDIKDQLDADTIDHIETLILEIMDLKESEDSVSLKLKVKELKEAVEGARQSI